MLNSTNDGYDFIAKLFHWVLAFMVVALLAAGLYMTGLSNENPSKFFYYEMHEATGVIVLLIVLSRLAWRLYSHQPSLPSHVPSWQRVSARSNQYILYALMIMMPVSGMLMTVLGGYPIKVYTLFSIPALAEGPNFYADIAHSIHISLVYFWFIFISFHVAAALYHHFWLKDNVLRRILP